MSGPSPPAAATPVPQESSSSGLSVLWSRLAWVPLGMLAAGAAVLLWRRMAGGLHGPLTWPVGFCSGLVLGGLAAGIRRSGRGAWGPILFRPWWLADGIVTGLVLIAGASLTLGGTSPGGVLALWMPLVIGETWGWTKIRGRRQPGARWSEGRRDLSQRLVRFRTPGGGDTIEAVVRCSLGPGERSGSVHVPFCPPFAGPPRVTVRQVSGPKARVRVGMVLAQGLRVDIRLGEAAGGSPQMVELMVTASG